MTSYIIILVLYLVATMIAGIWAGRKGNATDGFFVGGRSLGPIVIATTWAATLISSATFLGTAGYGYTSGWAGLIWGAFIMVFGGIFAWLLLAKKMRFLSGKLGALTIPNLLLSRFQDKKMNGLIAALIFIFYAPMLASQFAGAGIVFETLFGVDYIWGIFLFGILVVIYTTAGGLVAVAYTDLVQAVVMVVAYVIAIPVVLTHVGGMSNLTATLGTIDSGLLSIHGAGGYYTWAMIFSWIVYYLFGTAGQPYMLIRFFAIKDKKALKLALPIAMGVILICYFGTGLMGLSARAMIPDLTAPDYAMPQIAIKFLNPVLGGLLLSAVFAAMMSTVDSLLHVVGTTVAKDLIQQNLRPNMSNQGLLKVSRYATVACGVCGLLLAIRPPQSILTLITYAWTCLAASLFMPIVAGMYWKRFNRTGAYCSILTGSIVGAVVIGVFGGIAIGVHPMLIALPSAVLAGVIGTLITKPQPQGELEAFFPAVMEKVDFD